MSWLVNSFFSGMASGSVGGSTESSKSQPNSSEFKAKQSAEKIVDMTKPIDPNTARIAAGGFAPTIETKLIPPPIPKPPSVPGKDGKPVVIG